MKKKITLLLAAFVVAHSSSYALNVRGARSCGQWVKDRNSPSYNPGQAWIVGYLSGLAVGMDLDVIPRELDNESIYLWMDNYCRANPLKDIADGGTTLAKEILQKK